MAVMSGASLGARRRGRYATRSIENPNSIQIGAAASSPSATTTPVGKPVLAWKIHWMTVSAVNAPIITTSPWAKLIRPRMPYTMV